MKVIWHIAHLKVGIIEKVLNENKIEYIQLKKISIRGIKKAIKMYNPDIIHSHDFRASTICSILKGKRYLISHIHNNTPWIKRINLKSISFIYIGLRSDKVLTVSESIEKEYIFSRIIHNKILCIGNPVSRERILSKVKCCENIKKYDICCTARISKQKNPLRFLNVIKELNKDFPNISAIWIGDGPIQEMFIQQIKKQKLEENIKLLGYQENPYKYMKQSKIFLLTSDWEGYGLAAFEALTLGLPTIVSNVGGLPNIVDEKCGKLCNPKNINEYVIKIKELLSNDTKFKTYSKNAIDKSKQLDNIEIYMTKLSNIYNREI